MIDFIDPTKFHLAFIGFAAILIVLADWFCKTKNKVNIFLGIYGIVGVMLLIVSVFIGVSGGVQAIISYLIIGSLYAKARLVGIGKTSE